MRLYDITFITKEDLGDKPVKDVIENLDGKITATSSLGQKQFTYPIKKEKSGIYTTVVFEIDQEKLIELNKRLALKEEILRHLIIAAKAGTQSTEPAKAETTKKSEVEIPEKPEPSFAKAIEGKEAIEEEIKVEEAPEAPAEKKPVAKAKKEVKEVKEAKEAKEVKKKDIAVKAEPRAKTAAKKPAKEEAKTNKEVVEIEKETLSEEDRLKELDKKLDELLKD